MRASASLRPLLSLPVLALAAACAGAPAPPPPASPPTPLALSSSVTTPTAPSAPPPAPAPAAEIPPPPDAVRELQRTILAAHGAADVVASLTTEVGGRLAGSPADKLAVAWAKKAMLERGLANVHAEPVKVPVWQRGVETAAIVGATPHRLAIVALGWSGATPANGLEADVVRIDSMEALKSADPKTLRGKIVFLDVKMKDSSDGSGYGTAVVARASGPAEAAEKGALATVIRSIGTDASRFPHTGSMQRPKDAKSAPIAGALSNADADLLERVLTAHGSARLALNLGPRWLPDADSANVIGEIPGREKPAEIVVIGAHLDSWDLAEGAIDDGAGCGIVLEAGRALAALPTKPRRTIRVVLFAAEENSLAGGKEYARAHASEASNHVAALEADFGTGRVVHVQLLAAPEARDRFTAIAPLLAPLGVTPTDEKAYGGADVSPLRALGVPLLDLLQDAARYFDTHHTANDTFARIDSAALSQAAASFATTAWALSEMNGDLGRVPESDREREKH